ncbi:MAG TPA: nuclear transport factor 2 family protein [Marmoricola sp.]|nr:nuclear transport factor 2 family protein [Marmoricola sp.]
MTATPREYPDARLTVADDVDAPPAVLEPLHAYALGHATGRPDHFRRAFRRTAHVEGLRDGAFHSWDLETYCALFDGPAQDEETRSRVVDDVRVVGSVASATMTLRHGEDTFTDVFVLLGDADGWRIANKVYHRHER